MDIDATLFGQVMFAHLLLAGALTYIYARRPSQSAASSVLVIFAWLMPLVGPLSLAIYLAAGRKAAREAGNN
jgi:hypothetical protein